MAHITEKYFDETVQTIAKSLRFDTTQKPAEDGCGFVMRLSERLGETGRYPVEIYGRSFCADAGAYEILTIKHDGGFFRTDMLEKTE